MAKDAGTDAQQALRETFRVCCERALSNLGYDDCKEILSTAAAELQNKNSRGRPQKETLEGWEALMLTAYLRLQNDPDQTTLVRQLVTLFRANFQRGSHWPWNLPTQASLEKRLRRMIAQLKIGTLVESENPHGGLSEFRYVTRMKLTDK